MKTREVYSETEKTKTTTVSTAVQHFTVGPSPWKINKKQIKRKIPKNQKNW